MQCKKLWGWARIERIEEQRQEWGWWKDKKGLQNLHPDISSYSQWRVALSQLSNRLSALAPCCVVVPFVHIFVDVEFSLVIVLYNERINEWYKRRCAERRKEKKLKKSKKRKSEGKKEKRTHLDLQNFFAFLRISTIVMNTAVQDEIK